MASKATSKILKLNKFLYWKPMETNIKSRKSKYYSLLYGLASISFPEADAGWQVKKIRNTAFVIVIITRVKTYALYSIILHWTSSSEWLGLLPYQKIFFKQKSRGLHLILTTGEICGIFFPAKRKLRKIFCITLSVIALNICFHPDISHFNGTFWCVGGFHLYFSLYFYTILSTKVTRALYMLNYGRERNQTSETKMHHVVIDKINQTRKRC